MRAPLEDRYHQRGRERRRKMREDRGLMHQVRMSKATLGIPKKRGKLMVRTKQR